jgi:hypothetical protein
VLEAGRRDQLDFQPARIHDTPRPTTTIQWNLAQGNRSIRAGIRLLTTSAEAMLDMAGFPL